MQKQWKLSADGRAHLESSEDVQRLAEKGIHPVAVSLLRRRGIAIDGELEAFLHPNFESGIHDPMQFRQMPEAVARIFAALENQEKITVHGDYDADGVSGSAVLITTLRELESRMRLTGALKVAQQVSLEDIASIEVVSLSNESPPGEGGVEGVTPGVVGDEPQYVSIDPDSEPVPDTTADCIDPAVEPLETIELAVPSLIDSYIPHRDKEGYGLNPNSVRLLKERGTNLIITVDCGIANVEEIALARELGLDVIVVDHHQFGEILPDAILIHPRLPGETYPFPHLAAVGVAWKLACALVQESRVRNLGLPEGWEKWLLDFVSIATVTDMVQLVGENRVLETYGLKVMNKTRRPGLKKLIALAGADMGSVTSETIGFGLGPRINAAGRMDHASLALNVLLAENEEEANVYANELEGKNKDRQKATLKMMEEAEVMYENLRKSPPSEGGVEGVVPGAEGSESLVALWSESWSPSLVGLVAGKYLDKLGKPTIVIGKHGDRWIGSGRSFSAYDITEAVKTAGEGLLAHSGGHVQACGFSFSDDASLPLFVERLKKHASENLREADCVPILEIDAELALEDVTWSLIETLNMFEPYGEGNRKPIFLSKSLTVVSCDLMGSTQNHVRLRLRSPSGRMEQFVGFKMGDRVKEFAPGNTLDVVYDVAVNEWNGSKKLQCKIVDAKVV